MEGEGQSGGGGDPDAPRRLVDPELRKRRRRGRRRSSEDNGVRKRRANDALRGKVISKRFKIGEQLGSGSFGDVYACEDMAGGAPKAVKLERVGDGSSQLEYESRVYGALRGVFGTPAVYHFGKHGNFRALVMDRLRQSLQDLVDDGTPLPVAHACVVAAKGLQRLEDVHERGFLHRDLKPQNFVLSDDGELHLIDFGLAKKYVTAGGHHIPYREGKSLTGTPRYASVNCHLGAEQGRRDDVEALMYTVIFLCKGALPWQGIRARGREDKNQRIGDHKLRTSLTELCAGLPPEFLTVMREVRQLRFEERPEYGKYRALLRKAQSSNE